MTYEEFGTEPDASQKFFRHSVASIGPSAAEYAVTFQLFAVGNQTGDYVLTSSRIATTLSLLGFDFGRGQNLTGFVEYDFDVVIDKWKMPEVVIARGSVRNNIIV